MRMMLSLLISIGVLLISLSASISQPLTADSENMSRPTRPKAFSSPDELRSYLEQLSNFYAIQGRPRFGKRSHHPEGYYYSETPETLQRIPLTKAELLQILSSVADD